MDWALPFVRWLPNKVYRIGVQDHFGESAPYDHLMNKNGITVEQIVTRCKELVKTK